jgi:regulator of sigma E protease
LNLPWIPIALVGFGIVVFVHELGHFLAAKALGVGVEVFSLGWGPKLLGFHREGTEYRLSWLPIGGYCRFKGDEGLRRALEQNLAEMPREEGSFYSVPAWRRIIVVVAGPVASLLSAFMIFTLIWWIGFNVYSSDNRIILATDYTLDTFDAVPPATAAGLATGDRITAIDGQPVRNFQEIRQAVAVSAERTLSLQVERAGRTFEASLAIALDRSSGAGRIGVYSWIDPVISSVTAGEAAALADLRPGDRIVRAGSREVRHTIDLSQAFADHPASLPIVFERDGAARDAVLVLEYSGTQPNLGLEFVDHAYRSPRMDLGRAIGTAAAETWQTVVLTVRGIGMLFRGINLREAVTGPIGILDLIGTTAKSGFARGFGPGMLSTFELLAFLSVTLFLMNLLPLPALDGGQVVFSLAEMVRGRAVKPRMIWRVQLIGFSFMMVLFLVLTFNDLFRMGR